MSRNRDDTLSDQISRSVVSDSLRPHESQHARPPCPSPTPGVHWDSHPSSQWCSIGLLKRLRLIHVKLVASDVQISERDMVSNIWDISGNVTPFESIKSNLAFRYMTHICFHVPWVAMKLTPSPPFYKPHPFNRKLQQIHAICEKDHLFIITTCQKPSGPFSCSRCLPN